MAEPEATSRVDVSESDAVEGAQKRRLLSWPTMAFMVIAATGSIAQLPAAADFGLGAVTLYLIPALLFLFPVAMVASELGTTWDGGVFVWVREGLGERAGFQAIWLVFVESIALYPSLLSFGAASLAYAIGNEQLASNGLYTGMVILIVFWGATFVGLRGVGAIAKISKTGLIAGTLIPASSLIILMVVWLATGKTSQTPLEASDVVPPFTGISSIVLIVSNFIAFAGLEMNAVHVREMKNPRRFPRALMVAAPLVVFLYVLGTISIAVVVPNNAINLNAGAAQAFTLFGDGLGVPWLGQVLSALLVLGAMAAALTWVYGPSRGLLLAGRQGTLPRMLQRTNSAGAHVPILILQGCIVTALSLAFVILPSVNQAFWLLQSMTIILYLCMYVLLFIAAWRLRHNRKNVRRGYRTPALPVFATVGILCSISAILIALVPPSQIGSQTPVAKYAAGLILGVLVLAVPAQVLYRFRRPSWVDPDAVVSADDMVMTKDEDLS